METEIERERGASIIDYIVHYLGRVNKDIRRELISSDPDERRRRRRS